MGLAVLAGCGESTGGFLLGPLTSKHRMPFQQRGPVTTGLYVYRLLYDDEKCTISRSAPIDSYENSLCI
jgi:hypothetical protein